MNRYSASVIKVEPYLKQFMKVCNLAHPLSTLSKSKTLPFFGLFLSYMDKSPKFQECVSIVNIKLPHTRYYII